MKSIEDQWREMNGMDQPLTDVFPTQVVTALRALFTRAEVLARKQEAGGVNTDNFLASAVEWSIFMDTSTQQFNEAIKNMRGSDEHVLGKFLMAFLKIEYLINTLLLENEENPDQNEFRRLMDSSLANKSSKLPKTNKLYEHILPLIDSLRKLRNGVAHDIKFDFQSYEDGVLKKYLYPFVVGNQQEKTRLNSIVEITDYACFLLLLETKAYKSERDKFLSKYPHFLALAQRKI